MKLPDWLLSPKCFIPLLATSVFFAPINQALAGYVRSYYRKDGTYVNSYYRGSRGSYGGSSYTPSYQPGSLSNYGGSRYVPSSYQPSSPGSYIPSYQPSSPGRNYGVKGRRNGENGSGTYTSQELTGCRSPSDDEIKKAARGGRVEISGGDCIFIINPKSQDRYRW
jgi:hypothetical protein